MQGLVEQQDLLLAVPDRLRTELFRCYNEILRNFRERRWEPAELNGGKLSEVVYTILRGHVDRCYPSSPSKPRNMVDACRAFEQAPEPRFPRSVRIQLPRMLIALYEIRSNRGVGHVGGDVDPNHMDAVAVMYMSKWVVAELIRIFHSVDTDTANASVDAIVERTLPIVWQVGSKHRVLKTGLSMKDKTLLLLYHVRRPVSEGELVKWAEHSNPSIYRRDVLRKLHKGRFVEYDQDQRTVVLSPSGIRYVEERIDLDL